MFELSARDPSQTLDSDATGAEPRTPRGKTRMLIQYLDIRRYFGAGTKA